MLFRSAASAGYWSGQAGLFGQPFPGPSTTAPVPASGPVIYYRDPKGRPFYSLTPRSTDDGQPFVPVRASEDVSFDQPPTAPMMRKVLYYRNPMGLADVSPVPKKDSMGMDYIPVYDGEDADTNTVKVSAGKLQRTGVTTELVGKLTDRKSVV